MTFEETRDILTLIQVEWRQSFIKMTKRAGQAKLALWANEFRNDDYNAVYAAVRSIISSGNREFAPNIGNVRNTMRELFAPKELSASEAWSLVAKACKNGIYGAEAEYEKLPKEVQMAVGSAEQIREWSMQSPDTFSTVTASNFMRNFQIIERREKAHALMQEDIRRIVSGAAGQMALPGVG